MGNKLVKSLLVAAFGLFTLLNTTVANAQHEGPETTEASPNHTDPEKFSVSDVLMEHVMDNHEFHFFNYGGHHYSIPLPVIIYSPERGFSFFSSSNFHHGEKTYEGYKLNEKNKIEAVDANDAIDESVTVYDFSLTRNVVQMMLGLILLVLLMTNIAKKYKKNGIKVAPTGWQNAVEPVINFIQDDVAKPNLGHKYEKYMPYLLTVFFFILIGNIIGLIPGSANVTGNISFTLVLGFISFLVINFSSNKHYWGHIFWFPGVAVPLKILMMIVELLGVITKPFALIIRLFANMIAGHMIITCLIMLIFIFAGISKFAGIGFAPVSIAFTVFIYFIEILVAFIQAYIFTTLTAVFIGQAMEGSHDDAHAHGDAHATAKAH
ncbi:MAG: F0F1 ATP synthase subunit A [Bacteroidota bacterium]